MNSNRDQDRKAMYLSYPALLLHLHSGRIGTFSVQAIECPRIKQQSNMIFIERASIALLSLDQLD
jgi:hypothetical protein